MPIHHSCSSCSYTLFLRLTRISHQCTLLIPPTSCTQVYIRPPASLHLCIRTCILVFTIRIILTRSSTHRDSYRLFVESCQLVSIHLNSSLYPGQYPHDSLLDSKHAINSLPPRRTHIDSTYVAVRHIVLSLTL